MASGRHQGARPIDTSNVVAGNRLTKLLLTGCRISCSTLAGKRIARLINAILSRTHIAIASVTSPSPILRLTGQRVLA
jgi:hypothetical protein